MSRDKSNLKDAFWRNHFGFVAEARYHDVELPKSFFAKYDALHKIFTDSKQLSDLNGAPVASWVLARLAFLAGRKFPYGYGEVIGSDGGDFWLRFYCLSEELAASGVVTLSGSNLGVNLWINHLREEDGNGIYDAFTQEMLVDPSAVSKCRIVVQNTDMADPNIRFLIPRIYGWDGQVFLDGESPEHCVSPDDYD